MLWCMQPVTTERAPAPIEHTWPLLRLAFRPFFWLGALFSILCIGLWLASYSFGLPFSPMGGSYFWHLHEMLFGFVAAIMVGFLLTAVQNWTKVPSIKGWPLAILMLIWLMGRVAMVLPGQLPASVIYTVDIAFLPLAAACLARPIIKVKMWRNMVFVPILLFMALLNGWIHYAHAQPSPVNFLQLSHSMVILVALVMCIMGGRVFPMFTASGTHTKPVAALPWLEKASVYSVLLCVLVSLPWLSLPSSISACVFLFAGVINMIRALRWRIWVTLGTPLVWSLHISYWAMAIGLALLGLTEIGMFKSTSAAHHAITVGGMGLMILSMISRVSLGHTGRAITSSPLITLSLLLMVGAFITRVLASLITGGSHTLMIVAGSLWILAFAIFVVIYMPILFRPRVDGK